MSETSTKFVVFIDALSPNDLSRADRMADTKAGKMVAPAPRVTPRVMSEVYTGTSPAENGMARIHASDALAEEDPHRPEQQTIIEELADSDASVACIGMPYCVPFEGVYEDCALHGTSAQEAHFSPPAASNILTIPGPAGDLVAEQRHDITFDYMVDYTSQLFATARTLSADHDVVFIGHRLIDSYCHFQYDTGLDGRHAEVGERYRDRLAEVVDIQIEQLEARGDVFWFSDHGATQRTETFRVNKWLREQGYLEYEVDEEFIEKSQDYGTLPPEQHPVEERVENQYTTNHPGVVVERADAICEDPYDGCISVHNKAVVDDVMDDLRETGYFREVYHKSDLYDGGAEFYDEVPDIIPDRAEGVFVSGNVHPDPIGMGWHRTGVHDKWGCYGSSTGIDRGDTDPSGIHEMLRDFLNVENETKQEVIPNA